MTIHFGDSTSIDSGGSLGKILQVQSVTMKSTASFYGDYDNAFTTITGLTVNITPASSSNKILVLANISCNANGRYSGIRLERDSGTFLVVGNADGNRARITAPVDANDDISYHALMVRPTSLSYLDTAGTTSQISYKITMNNCNTNNVLQVVNRMVDTSNSTWNYRPVSTITAIEVSA